MQAIILSIGNELLNGKTINSNAAYIAGALFDIGIRTDEIITIGDNSTKIVKSLKESLNKSDLVIMTGGLGPTHDDITKSAVAEFFDAQLVLNQDILHKVEERFKRRGMIMPPVNRNQALVPANAELVENPVGTAPGLLFKTEDKFVFILPGIPLEMEAIIDQSIIPFLKENCKLEVIQVHLYRTTGIAESKIYQICKDLFEHHPLYEIAFLPKYIGVEIRIAVHGDEQKFRLFENELYSLIGKYIYTKGDQELEEVISNLLKKENLTLSVAESCTGGLLADKLTDVPGSSDYFLGSVTAYSNESKMKYIGVKEATLELFGAVSDEVAREMAAGARAAFGTNLALSTTGIAGPSGATEMKPIGLVYIALATAEKTISKKFNFSNIRRLNKEAGAQAALEMLRRELLNLPSGAA